MNPLRSKAMIASAMSLVVRHGPPVRPIRPTGRRRTAADAADAGSQSSAASNEPFDPGRYVADVNPIDPAPASTGATSYSLIGW